MNSELPIPINKALVLLWLSDRLTSARIPPSVIVRYSRWMNEPDKVLADVWHCLGSTCQLIVRSSAKSEDQGSGSQAGHFLSVPNVVDDAQLSLAISDVFRSYEKTEEDDIVFVQPMLQNASTVGVIFTADPATGAPYLIVNFTENASTNAITSGAGNHQTWIALVDGFAFAPTSDLQKLPALVSELSALVHWRAIDIEFAVCDGILYLLQARPLEIPRPALERAEFLYEVSRVQAWFDRWSVPHPWLVGSSTVLGVMPDWNPAEIIGTHPRPLALSLYRFLVTDARWSMQRSVYGYRPLPGVPLLVELNGMPYIDVRASLNSLIPSSLENRVAERLVDACIALLKARPELHDKLEFMVLPTCLACDTDVELERRFGTSLGPDEQRAVLRALRDFTAALLKKRIDIAVGETKLVTEMVSRRATLMGRSQNLMERIYWLLSDCGEFGVRPFVGQARRAFIATEILKSFVRNGVMSQGEFNYFMRSLRTVAGQFQSDQQSLTLKELVHKYGHLRPGTYDIRSLRYDEDPNAFLRPTGVRTIPTEEAFSLTTETRESIQLFLDGNKFDISCDRFLDFARESIESRESSKFAFTRNLSDALLSLAELGAQYNFTRDDLSYLSISDLISTYPSARDPSGVLTASIDRGRASFRTTAELLLPSLMRNRNEIVSFVRSNDQPNFIGNRVATGPVAHWPGCDRPDGVVLFIESADPGYDWIFGYELLGLVTMYGGANSHMAIRAYELGLTAVIGAGPNLFRRWSRARLVRIDPTNRKLEMVQ